jgi:O-antigen ligase
MFCYFLVCKSLSSEKHVRSIIYVFFAMASLSAAYALIHHATLGFAQESSNVSSRPLFPEHGSYASYLAIVLGMALGAAFGMTGNRKGFVAALSTCVLTTVGILFSYTRAAWLGVAVLVLFFLVVKAREVLRPRAFVLLVIVTAFLSVPIFFLGVQDPLERNLSSMTDVERNLSNLERINRWVAAINIIKAHPFLGVGYGTYAVQYEHFRERRLETPVSNFSGSAHNDYLQFWAEAGIPGIVAWIALVCCFVITGVRRYYRIRDPFLRNVLLGCVGGVLTYLVHGVFNTFLHFDKVAVPFWVAIAVAVVILQIAPTKEDVEPWKDRTL